MASAYPRTDGEEDYYVNLANRGAMLFLDKDKSAFNLLSGRTVSTLNAQTESGHVLKPDYISNSAHIIPNNSDGSQPGIQKQVISDAGGKVAGWYDRNTGSVRLVKGVATPSTVAHEIGWHATFHWAEKKHPELHKKLIQYAKDAPARLAKFRVTPAAGVGLPWW